MNVATQVRTEDSLAAQAPDGKVPAVVGPAKLPATADAVDPSQLMGAIIAAARDPAVDADKMERLLAMYERLSAAQAKTEYFRALAIVKPNLPVIGRNGKIEVRKKTASGDRDGDLQQSTPYALWEDIDEAITPILTDNGFTLTFRAGTAPDGKVTVTGVLAHTAGHIEETTISLPHDSTGSKNAVQAVGSSLSYGKRYSATLLLNIRTRGEDDDGRAAGGNGPISTEQMDTIMGLIDRADADPEAFCKYMGVNAIKDIPTKDFNKAITALNTKLHRSAKRKEAAQ